MPEEGLAGVGTGGQHPPMAGVAMGRNLSPSTVAVGGVTISAREPVFLEGNQVAQVMKGFWKLFELYWLLQFVQFGNVLGIY